MCKEYTNNMILQNDKNGTIGCLSLKMAGNVKALAVVVDFIVPSAE